jgi:hypothetical protein
VRVGAQALLGERQFVKGAHDVGLPVVRAQRHALAQGLAFEQDAHARQVFQVGQRHGRNPKATLSLRHHQRV